MERLRDEPVLAVDTEADSFFSYMEKVCLIQISSSEEDFIVDPLADIDLAPLGEMLADESTEKLFHDGEFDVLLMKRHAGFEFRSLFDTRVAAASLGYEALGLAPLLSQEFGVELDKTQQMSDWSRRPLTRDQLGYARLDTHYLIELATKLKAELAEAGRGIVVEGECRRLEGLEASPRVFQPNEFMRLKGSKTLDMKQLGVLKAAFAERDRIARARDVPPFKVVAHPALVELARRSPKNLPQLAKVAGFSPKVIKRVGESMLDAVDRGLEAGPLESAPRLPSKQGTDGMDEFDLELWERLKGCRKRLSEAENMDSSLVLNRHVLLDMVKRRPSDDAELGEVAGIQAWQLELHGQAWLETVRAFLADLEAGRIESKGKRRRR